MNNVPYTIALYVRQARKDNGMCIQNQKLALRQYADSMEDVQNAEILEFVDNGCSGASFDRPKAQEMFDLVREGKINCILVKNISRLSRSVIDIADCTERFFPLHGVRFISIDDTLDTEKLQGGTGSLLWLPQRMT